MPNPPSGYVTRIRVDRIEGVAPQRCLPLAVEQPRLARDLTGSDTRNSVTRQDNVILIGIDPGHGM